MNQHEAPPRRRPSAKRRAKKQALWTLSTAAAVILLCIACLPRLLFQGTIPVADSASVAALPARAEETAGSIPEETPEPEKEPEPVVETIRFSATGDDLIHSPIYKQAQRRATGTEKYSFDYCYEHIAPFYAQQDVNWINQETLCNDELEPSSYPCFSTPGDCARALYRAGVRVFSLSNNHTYDKGAAGIAATLRFWESMPEDVVTTGLWRGTEDYGRIPLQTINGVTIAYLSYTEHTNGIPQSSAMPANIIYTSQTDVIEQQVRAARQQADFVVVGVHWGVENSHTIVDSQRTLAQNLANWGRGPDHWHPSACAAGCRVAHSGGWPEGVHCLLAGEFSQHAEPAGSAGGCDPDGAAAEGDEPGRQCAVHRAGAEAPPHRHAL